LSDCCTPKVTGRSSARRIGRRCRAVLDRWPEVRLGLHLHTLAGLALAGEGVARTGVSLGGATLDGSTGGRLRGGGGGERLEPTYRFFLPAGSGALLTMGLRTLP